MCSEYLSHQFVFQILCWLQRLMNLYSPEQQQQNGHHNVIALNLLPSDGVVLLRTVKKSYFKNYIRNFNFYVFLVQFQAHLAVGQRESAWYSSTSCLHDTLVTEYSKSLIVSKRAGCWDRNYLPSDSRPSWPIGMSYEAIHWSNFIPHVLGNVPESSEPGKEVFSCFDLLAFILYPLLTKLGLCQLAWKLLESCFNSKK